jgi:hypothetical protein
MRLLHSRKYHCLEPGLLVSILDLMYRARYYYGSYLGLMSMRSLDFYQSGPSTALNVIFGIDLWCFKVLGEVRAVRALY